MTTGNYEGLNPDSDPRTRENIHSDASKFLSSYKYV